MQILGKRSRVLLTVLCAVMLIAVGISFAAWDSTAVKADGGNMSDYANAKVGDIVTFGRYYDYEKDANGNYVKDSTVIDKYPVSWLVVDKNERTGQLTLMSQYIIACGSYFGNFYDDGTGSGYHYANNIEIGGRAYNQAYCDSTLRAYLNNLERLDVGGDEFVEPNAENGIIGGYVPSNISSSKDTGLLSSIGFSNRKYWTGLTTDTFADYDSTLGFVKSEDTDNNELYYKRPLSDAIYANRPVAKGFFDEAFSYDEKAKIVPKTIAGYTGCRWPDNAHDVSNKGYVEGTVDKVWVPSATELNAMNGADWNGNPDSWTNPSDESGSNVFEYFKNYANYRNPYADRNNTSLEDALIAKRTMIAKNGVCGNFSIPIYKYKSTELNTEISTTNNTSEHYWTRSPMSTYFASVRFVQASTGRFRNSGTYSSSIGVRPCITLQY